LFRGVFAGKQLYSVAMEDMEDPVDIGVGRQISIADLKQNPALALGVLEYCLAVCGGPSLRESWYELTESWMDEGPAIPLKKARRLLEKTTDYEAHERIRRWAGRGGRPSKLRQVTIMAFVRKHYLHETWREVTKQLCPCGQLHTPGRLATKCQPKLEAEVRRLKPLLRDSGIVLPELPTIL